MPISLSRRLTAEFLGTAFLVLAVVGSGIMAQTLSEDVGLQLLENAIATAGALAALILAFGPVSGAHFNPVVTAAEVVRGGLSITDAGAYVIAQITGGIVGTMAANVIFGLNIVEISQKDRSGFNLILSEGIATLGLLLVIYGVVHAGKPTLAAATVACYIGGAYWFTSSTSFANPAVTIARTLSDSFAGIHPANAPGFIAAQLMAGAGGIALLQWLWPPRTQQHAPPPFEPLETKL